MYLRLVQRQPYPSYPSSLERRKDAFSMFPKASLAQRAKYAPETHWNVSASAELFQFVGCIGIGPHGS